MLAKLVAGNSSSGLLRFPGMPWSSRKRSVRLVSCARDAMDSCMAGAVTSRSRSLVKQVRRARGEKMAPRTSAPSSHSVRRQGQVLAMAAMSP